MGEVFDGCYSVLQKRGIIPVSRTCKHHKYCFPTKAGYLNIRRIIGNQSISVKGSLMEPTKIINNPMYRAIWKDLFDGIEPEVNNHVVRRMLLRLLLNPSEDLRLLLLKEKKRLLVLRHTIGLQLRMGGKYADTPERYSGVPISRIGEVVDQLRSIIRQNKWEGNVQVYISSDSSYTVNLIRNMTSNEFPVVVANLFKRGHTRESAPDKKAILSQVMTDMYFMAISDKVVVTWPSSLGRYMCFISNDDKCTAVLNWRVPHKQKPFPL